jgi:hypothetical protein
MVEVRPHSYRPMVLTDRCRSRGRNGSRDLLRRGRPGLPRVGLIDHRRRGPLRPDWSCRRSGRDRSPRYGGGDRSLDCSPARRGGRVARCRSAVFQRHRAGRRAGRKVPEDVARARPASPSSTTVEPRPAAAASRPARRTRSSSTRPTTVGASNGRRPPDVDTVLLCCRCPAAAQRINSAHPMSGRSDPCGCGVRVRRVRAGTTSGTRWPGARSGHGCGNRSVARAGRW